jgi:Fe-S cluster assembly protein SufD
MLTQALDQYVAEYERTAGARRGEHSWLTGARQRALDSFLLLGFPTTHDEEWRFTSVAPIAESSFALPSDGHASLGAEDLAPFRWPLVRAHEIVFVNGRYAAGLSTVDAQPRGVRVESLASVLASGRDEVEPYLARLAGVERHAFSALNTALFGDGAFVWIPARTIVEVPIHIMFVSSPSAVVGGRPTMSHPRVLVALGENSQASIVESYAGSDRDPYLTNAVTEIVLGESAVLDHCKLQREGARGYHVAAMHVAAARAASLRAHAVSLGGSLVRNEVTAVLDGEGVECTLNGLYLADGRRLVDNHTTIDHAKPHCGSREVYKGILAGHARAVFNGKIIVRPDAQKTDARQTNKALLLSEDALINTKPQLEIFANDVKCTHGAAVGQMDDEAVFYLRSRGLSEAEARAFLIRAFAGDVLNRLPLESLRTAVEEVAFRSASQYSATGT